MPWLKLDEGFAEHEKILGLSHPAFRLHVTGMLACARNLTDGYISEARLATVCAISGTPRKHVAELEAFRLWRRVDAGWQINDYLDYNPSAEKVREERAKTLERQRKWKERRDANASHDPTDNGVANGVSNGVSNAAPTRPDPTRTTTESVEVSDPSFLPSPATDGTEGRSFDFEAILKDAS